MNCDLCENGKCTKWCKKSACEPSTTEWLDSVESYDDAEFISANEMCRKCSIFGNDYVGLTQKDIDRIKNGEIIHIPGEYGIFIGFLEDKTNESI